MPKRYATTYSNGHAVETSSPHEAMNFCNYDDAQTWRVAGKVVTAVEFFAAARAAVDAAWDKKNQTHKRVRVLHGNSVACYVNKWVPR
jgi:hypothetical protein